MVEKDLLMAKAGAVKHHLNRIKEKTDTPLNHFLKDIDCQEIILFNLQMAIQNCIDIASHIISQEGLGVPGSYNETFYLLESRGYIDTDTTEKMVKAVGFRNLMVHEYAKISLNQVFEIAKTGPNDINQYLRMIFSKLKLSGDP